MLVGAGGGGGDAEPTQYGFEIPLGDPGSLHAAARACSTWATAMATRASSVRSGAQTASGEWSGTAESQFNGFAAHVVHVYSSLGDVIGEAGGRLSAFADELETAQRLTQKALGDCETYDGQAAGHRQDASTHGSTVTTLTTQQAATTNPHQSAELGRQISHAQAEQHAAQHAASIAEGELQAAERRGSQAWTEYQRQAATAAGALSGLGSRVEKVQSLPASAQVCPAEGPGVSTGFWPFFNTAAASDVTGGTVGFAQALAARYRVSDLVLPIGKQAERDLATLGQSLSADGDDPYVTSAGGLWVPKGSTADPKVDQIRDMSGRGDFTQPGKGTLAPSDGDLPTEIPGWADGASKGLTVLGSGLILYSTGADSWDEDEKDHPNWSTTHKVIDTTQKTVVVGGSTVAVSLAYAETGGELGATIGTFVGPEGTVVGGVIGGVAGAVGGGIVGAHVGEHVGHALEDAGSGIGHAATSLWHDL